MLLKPEGFSLGSALCRVYFLASYLIQLKFMRLSTIYGYLTFLFLTHISKFGKFTVLSVETKLDVIILYGSKLL